MEEKIDILFYYTAVYILYLNNIWPLVEASYESDLSSTWESDLR